MPYNDRKVVGIILLLLIVVTVGISIYRADESEPIQIIQTIPNDYLSVFSKEHQSALGLTYGSKIGDRDFCCISDRDSSHTIFITRMDNIFSSPLVSLIKEENEIKRHSRQTGKWYYKTGTKFLDIDCQTKSSPATNELILNFNGSSYQRLALNDTVACYNVDIASFALLYDKEWAPEFNVAVNTEYYSKGLLPVEILILRKNNKFYFLMMTINKEDAKLEDGDLLNMTI